jgi:hypothetical protein
MGAHFFRFFAAAIAASFGVVFFGYWGIGVVVAAYLGCEHYLNRQLDKADLAARRQVLLDESGLSQENFLGNTEFLPWAAISSVSLICSESCFQDPWFGFTAETDWVFRIEAPNVTGDIKVISVEYGLISRKQVAQIAAYLGITDVVAVFETMRQIDCAENRFPPKPPDHVIRWDWERAACEK